ncbi:PHP domain-containing protein [Propionibacterium sp.]|uniref:PHP domain-containing protein n=1 Tax=Propionibacterium sp. TaxID=1977903 RepID=UPI0039E901E9
MRIDLHTHSNVSDGTDSPTALVRRAQELGVQVVALSDHDTFDGIGEALEAGRRFGVFVLPGIEISTHVGHTEVHLLGYGADPWNPALREALADMRVSRAERVPLMLAKLHELGVDISEDDVAAQAGHASSIGRPHVADALVAAGYVKNRNEAFDRFLDDKGPAFVPRRSLELPTAIDLVHGAHGACVIAHPWIGSGREVVTPALLASLTTEHGLEGIEVDHPAQDQETRALLFELGGRLGLIRTGSSDYHGTGKTGHELGCETSRPTALRELATRITARGGSLGGVEQVLGRI